MIMHDPSCPAYPSLFESRATMSTEPDTRTARVSAIRLWSGRILCVLPALMLLLGGTLNLVKPEFVVKGTTEMGYAEGVIRPLGIVVLCATTLFLIPRTSVLGAILLTGYLGGAVATHVHAGQGLGQILFPAVFGALLWAGLCLRSPKISAVIFGRP